MVEVYWIRASTVTPIRKIAGYSRPLPRRGWTSTIGRAVAIQRLCCDSIDRVSRFAPGGGYRPWDHGCELLDDAGVKTRFRLHELISP